MLIEPVIKLTWDDSKLRSGHNVDAFRSDTKDADGLRTGFAFINRSSMFGHHALVADDSSIVARKAFDSFLQTFEANADAFAKLKNTFQRNDDHAARAGEVSLFINATGTKNDLRWRGDMKTAPQPILDLLAAARALETASKD